MKKIGTVFWLLFIVINTSAQTAIIKDKDGYTNVRTEPKPDSKVIYKIMDAELFFYDMETERKQTEWIKVYVPKNKYSITTGQGAGEIIGFIHTSRLLPLDELENYSGTDISFSYKLDTFSIQNKIMEYDNQSITTINGRRYYGTDGGKPTKQINAVEVSIKGKKVNVPNIFYEDLFECNNHFNIYRYKEVYFIEQWNSDGAGGYLLVWSVDSEGIRQRLILIP